MKQISPLGIMFSSLSTMQWCSVLRKSRSHDGCISRYFKGRISWSVSSPRFGLKAVGHGLELVTREAEAQINGDPSCCSQWFSRSENEKGCQEMIEHVGMVELCVCVRFEGWQWFMYIAIIIIILNTMQPDTKCKALSEYTKRMSTSAYIYCQHISRCHGSELLARIFCTETHLFHTLSSIHAKPSQG